MVISNHVNWIDIMYLGARLYPISFLAKEDISKAPIIGKMAK
jgi:1-acyl-sn-glycerol-3-phosphate acyltransferase